MICNRYPTRKRSNDRLFSGPQDDDRRGLDGITHVALGIPHPEAKGRGIRSRATGLQFKGVSERKYDISVEIAGAGKVRRNFVQLRINEIARRTAGGGLHHIDHILEIALFIGQSHDDLQFAEGRDSGGAHAFQGELRFTLERIFAAGRQQGRSDDEGQETPHGSVV